MSWRPVVSAAFAQLETEFEGSEFETKDAALVWHYRRASDFAAAEDRARGLVPLLRETVGRKWKVETVEGKCVVEVRARGLDKGAVVGILLKLLDWGFVACFGDDRTDEGEGFPFNKYRDVTGMLTESRYVYGSGSLVLTGNPDLLCESGRFERGHLRKMARC